MERYIDPDRPLKYQYKCVNKSVVDRYVLRHWWPLAIKAIPARMPSNLVSMVGNLGSYFAFLILCGAIFGPVPLAGRAHPWIFGLVAFGLFFYQTFDALDGIQARRTGAAGPLGEFVDHWFDSFNVFLLPLGIALAFPVVNASFVAICCILFAAADWLMLRSIRNTAVLVFDAVSTEEGQVLAQLFYLSIWILGYDFWALPGALGFPPIWLGYAAIALGMLGSSINSFRTAGGLSLLAIELASLLPLVVWTVLCLPLHGSRALLLGGLIIGFSGSLFSGGLLKERLLGTVYPPFRQDILIIDAVLLLSVLVPGLPSWLPIGAGLACLAALLVALGIQFNSAIERVKLVCGRGLFGLVGTPEPRPGIPRA